MFLIIKIHNEYQLKIREISKMALKRRRKYIIIVYDNKMNLPHKTS